MTNHLILFLPFWRVQRWLWTDLCYYVKCNCGCSNDFLHGKFASPPTAGGDTGSMIILVYFPFFCKRWQGKRGHCENYPLSETNISGTAIGIGWMLCKMFCLQLSLKGHTRINKLTAILDAKIWNKIWDFLGTKFMFWSTWLILQYLTVIIMNPYVKRDGMTWKIHVLTWKFESRWCR